MSSSRNTGLKIYSLLIEINNRTGLPTGRTKPNVSSDPDYIAPVTDYDACPINVTTTTTVPTTTTTTLSGAEFQEGEFNQQEFN